VEHSRCIDRVWNSLQVLLVDVTGRGSPCQPRTSGHEGGLVLLRTCSCMLASGLFSLLDTAGILAGAPWRTMAHHGAPTCCNTMCTIAEFSRIGGRGMQANALTYRIVLLYLFATSQYTCTRLRPDKWRYQVGLNGSADITTSGAPSAVCFQPIQPMSHTPSKTNWNVRPRFG
jgi:hypothetical protein